MTQRLAAVALALILLACTEPAGRAGKPGAAGGTIVIATTADPDALFPPLALNIEARQATELIFEYLADVGPGMNTIGDEGFVKQIASGWTWSGDSSSISFTIDPRARWHDGTRLTADDVAFTFSVYTDEKLGASVSSSLSEIDSVSAPDSGTAVFWFGERSPRQFYHAAAMMLILPRHVYGSAARDSLRAFSSRTTPMGSGRFRLAGWMPGSHFELARVDDHYRSTAKPARVLWTITPEYQSAVARLLGGEADVFPTIRQETIPSLAEKGDVNLVTLPGSDYVFMHLNHRDPRSQSKPHALFASREMRRAITMALDRTAMVKNLFDTLASVSIGPAVRAFPTTDTSLAQIRHDKPLAERLLDSLGWRRAREGALRTRNGVPLRFDLLVPVSSLSRVRLSVLLQEQLRQVGIEVNVEKMDYAAFSARQSARSFDAALASWHLGSSPGAVKVTWTSEAAGKGGLNYGSYRNPRFDALVDRALAATDVRVSRELFRQANQIIVDDAAAVWLYEPKTLIAISDRIRHGPMRPNAWWLGIGDWEVQPAERETEN